jgi:tRNA1(Val) A37 N6-methylase TrmN6
MLCAKNLLSRDGALWLILPYRHLDLIMNYAKKHELFLNSLITINAKVSKPKSRIVLCLSKNKSLLNQQTITVRNEDNSYTDTYINLTREFHSKELKK